MNWNAGLYDQKHHFVSKYGEDVIEMLAPKPGEWILDLGCGTGDLAYQIAESGARVVGLDQSATMIETARKKYPDLQFEEGSATSFAYDFVFDAVFSNATLHWVLDPQKAIERMHRCLKPGGRLVLEMGGKGNVQNIVTALLAVLSERGYAKNANQQVWYFPSLSAYTSLLELNGFRVAFASNFDRPTLLKEEQGIRNWLIMFGQSYLKGIPVEEVDSIIECVEERIRPTNYIYHQWYADYVRLRVVAFKES